MVCVSDTGKASAKDGAFKLPPGDILIHAGDLTSQGSLSELRKTVEWIEAAPYEVKIVVAGEHDVTLDEDFYHEYGSYFHNQDLQDAGACRALFEDCPSILYLEHGAASVRLRSGARFRVFGSPYSPVDKRDGNGKRWAFQYAPEKATSIWEGVPYDVDVCVTHTPPEHTATAHPLAVPMGAKRYGGRSGASGPHWQYADTYTRAEASSAYVGSSRSPIWNSSSGKRCSGTTPVTTPKSSAATTRGSSRRSGGEGARSWICLGPVRTLWTTTGRGLGGRRRVSSTPR